jgi:predicted RNA-binding protein with PUA-like domain
MAYWLFKSEPDEYSIDCLAKEPDQTTVWEGIRNYQARNLLRDEVAPGDLVFFYHSSCAVPGIAGIAKVASKPYPDPGQFDPESPYFDPKANRENPRWFTVDIRYKQKFKEILSRKAIKEIPALADMVLFKQGRLSVQPVTAAEWSTIVKLSKA